MQLRKHFTVRPNANKTQVVTVLTHRPFANKLNDIYVHVQSGNVINLKVRNESNSKR